MKNYSIAVMSICVFFFAIIFLEAVSSFASLKDPEGGLSEYAYKKYSSFDYYKQEEEKEILKRGEGKSIPLENYLASIDWQKRWKMEKELSIASVVHKEKHNLYRNCVYTFIIFSLLFIGHIFLYRWATRCKTCP